MTWSRRSNRLERPSLRVIRVDSGPGFVSRDLDMGANRLGVALDFSRPGNAFNRKGRSRCLNSAWFMSLDDARSKCEAWRSGYNEQRHHSAVGDKYPIELMNGAGPSIWSGRRLTREKSRPALIQGWGQDQVFGVFSRSLIKNSAQPLARARLGDQSPSVYCGLFN